MTKYRVSIDIGGTFTDLVALNEKNGKRIKLKSKCTVKIEKDDIFVARTLGGGGYRNPLERNPELVQRDVLNGLVSLQAAKKDYGVIINPATMKIDWKSTEQLRSKK